jgi:hypothetical protein
LLIALQLTLVYMKNIFFCLAFIFPLFLLAQKPNDELFDIFSIKSPALDHKGGQNIYTFQLSPEKLTKLIESGYTRGKMQLVIAGELFTLLLEPVHKKQNDEFSYTGLHLNGTVQEKPYSKVVLSIFKDRVYGVIVTPEHNWELETELFSNGNSTSRLEIKQVAKTNSLFECKTELVLKENIDQSHSIEKLNAAAGKKVLRLAIEVSHSTYQLFGKNIAATLAFTESMLNVNTLIFRNDSIELIPQSIYIWTTQDPIEELSLPLNLGPLVFSKNALKQQGTASMFLVSKYNLGFASVRNSLCDNVKFGITPVLSTSANNYPSFTASYAGLSHEIGHILGCWHTFQCQWGPQQNLAIDNFTGGATPPACGYTQGAPNPTPTIMGYGTDFSLLNGFGAEPRARMLQNIANAGTCIKDSSFYASCQLDRFTLWSECLPDPNPNVDGDEKAIVKGIVTGTPGGRFNTKLSRLSFAPGVPVGTNLFNNPLATPMVTGAGLDSVLNLPYNTEITLGTWLVKDTTVMLSLIDKLNPACSVDQPIYFNALCKSGNAPSPDLALTATTSTPTPAQWSNYSVTYTLTNQAAVATQNIQVEIPAVVGGVYQGGNVYQATTGVFDGIKTWIIPTVAAGQSVTLTLNYFNLSTSPKKYFAQVSAMSGIDLDSAPGNNNTGVPVEDDEVSITINGGVQPPTCSINATVSNLACNNNGTNSISSDDTYTYLISVSGSNTGSSGWSAVINGQTVTGSYNIPKSVNGGLIGGGAVQFAVGDQTNSTCTTNVTLTPPAPCSTVQPPTGPCASKSDFPWHEWIAGVQVGTLNNLSSKSAYSNYPSPVTELTTGSHAVSLTTEFSYFAYDEYWKIWLDLNGDGALDDATETVYQGKLNQPANGNAKHTLAGTLVIPASMSAGTRLMRVSMKRSAYALPCEALPFGEVEDYQVRVVSGVNPTCTITAAATSIVCNNNGTASTGTDDTFGFSLLVNGTNTGTQGWTATIGNQTISGSYGVSKSLNGYAISSGNLNFTVRDAQQNTCVAQVSVVAPAPCSGGGPAACASSSVFPWHEWISNVKVGNLDFASGKSNFSDYSSATVTAARGQSLAVSLTTSFSWFTADQYYKIWIDYNQDGAFDPSTETAYSGILSAPPDGTTSKVLNGNLIVPATAALGKTKMRISMKRGAYPTVCEAIPFGEVEEYSVQVNPPAVLQNSVHNQISAAQVVENQDDIQIFPNPASGVVSINWKDQAPANVYLMSSSGVVLEQTPAVTQAEFDVSQRPSGLYFVRIEAAGKRAITKRVVVVRD